MNWEKWLPVGKLLQNLSEQRHAPLDKWADIPGKCLTDLEASIPQRRAAIRAVRGGDTQRWKSYAWNNTILNTKSSCLVGIWNSAMRWNWALQPVLFFLFPISIVSNNDKFYEKDSIFSHLTLHYGKCANFNRIPAIKVHGADLGLTWVLSAPDGPHVGPMKLAIRGILYARRDPGRLVTFMFNCFKQ